MTSVLNVTFALILIFAWLARRIFSRRASFRGVPGPPSSSWFKGDLPKLIHRHSGEWMANFVESYGSFSKISAPYGKKWLHTYDASALYSIAIKDQESWWKNTGDLNTLLLGPGLLTTDGAQHRKQRKMLTPVFSIAYLRNVTSVFYETTYKLRDALRAEVNSEVKEVDMLQWIGRAALELLGQGALGHSFDPLLEDVSDDFAECVKSFFGALNRLALARFIFRPFVFLGPAWFRRMIVDILPSKRVQNMKHIVDTMHNRAVQIVNGKRALISKGDDTMLEKVSAGKDVMSILLRANQQVSEKERLSDEELFGQISTFILAGMDTTSNATCRLLHLLSMNPSVQEKLRTELRNAQAGTEIEYDALMDLPYLDAVCRETLRLYGPVRLITRRARKDTVLPLHEPITTRGGTTISEVAVPEGTVVILNLWACNTNKALWGDDALEWKPERWLAPLPRTLEEARVPGVYSHLMSFHGGGRSCIGFKYAQLELKVMLAVLLTNFRFELTDKPIVWNHAGVSYPSVGMESKKPEMPLKVSICTA